MPSDNIEAIRASRRKWYANNKSKAYNAVRDRKLELKKWLYEFKSTLKCSRCEENHPATLQFHHKNPGEKEFVICKMVVGGYSKERIMEEIGKCEVLCANCHAKEHYNIRDWHTS